MLTTEEFEDFESLRSEQLLKFIQKLPIHYRTAVNLYGIEGYSHKEVGKIMNVPTVTSRSYYFRGRNKLKVMFDNFNKTI